MSEQKKELRVYCPSGCGTPLVKRRFVNVFNEELEGEENLFCSKCCIRWIPEQHSKILGLMEKLQIEEIKP